MIESAMEGVSARPEPLNDRDRNKISGLLLFKLFSVYR
jgi:hypothetical protein